MVLVKLRNFKFKNKLESCWYDLSVHSDFDSTGTGSSFVDACKNNFLPHSIAFNPVASFSPKSILSLSSSSWESEFPTLK